MRRGHPHEGIDISSRGGFAVRAAAAGTVAFSDRKPGYGRVIILTHPGGYKTVYAHNQDNLVAPGARVAQGALIADMGRTGEASGPHLHFEVRKGDRPLDPLACLPDRAKGR
jgi:murein DD-endopeptidase MepM/ murein hydrolase activator NlpD